MVGLGLAISVYVSVVVTLCSFYHCWLFINPSFASWRLFLFIRRQPRPPCLGFALRYIKSSIIFDLSHLLFNS
ncbi:hypothetical protein BDV19DRAFT_66352 [Aspergillus venezuelensis]